MTPSTFTILISYMAPASLSFAPASSGAVGPQATSGQESYPGEPMADVSPNGDLTKGVKIAMVVVFDLFVLIIAGYCLVAYKRKCIPPYPHRHSSQAYRNRISSTTLSRGTIDDDSIPPNTEYYTLYALPRRQTSQSTMKSEFTVVGDDRGETEVDDDETFVEMPRAPPQARRPPRVLHLTRTLPHM